MLPRRLQLLSLAEAIMVDCKINRVPIESTTDTHTHTTRKPAENTFQPLKDI